MTHSGEFAQVDNPYYEDPSVALLYGDCRTVMAELGESCVDAVVTDAPYELGIMGRGWDRSGVAFDPETWRQVLRVLKPGGHLLTFGGTRTFHRVAVPIEDAGFEIRDCLSWLYGQGFPKTRTMLKPAWEPILVARKPFVGPANGTGALNIEACRITSDGGDRWPANVALDEEAAELLNEQSGDRPTGAVRPYVSTHDPRATPASFSRGGSQQRDFTKPADAGGASRFFYVSKASKAERPRSGDVMHPTVKPLALMRWLVRLATPSGGIVLDPFAGSGTTAEACVMEGLRCIAIENHEPYLPLTVARLAKPIQVQVHASPLACESCGRTAYWCACRAPLSGSPAQDPTGKAAPVSLQDNAAPASDVHGD